MMQIFVKMSKIITESKTTEMFKTESKVGKLTVITVWKLSFIFDKFYQKNAQELH